MQSPLPHRDFWLVIPSYNDSERLSRYLPELCAALEGTAIRALIQVVDDGSCEEDKRRLTDLVCEVQTRHPGVQPVISLGVNQGKGAAILRGWAASGEAAWVGFLDADGAIPAYEVRRLTDQIAAQTGKPTAIFASRVQMRGREVRRSLKRHLAGRIFASLVGTWIDSRVYDSQCGFKLIPREAYHKIEPLLREQRFAFDVELLAALNHVGCRVEEAPIDWTDIPGTKVSLVRDSLRMFASIRAIRTRMRTW